MMRRKHLLSIMAAAVGFLLLPLVTGIAAQNASPDVSGLRGSAALGENASPPRISQVEEASRQRVRSYPEQPPTIPHKIEGYQLDKNSNRCLTCHARSRVSESGAPMISITHFMDRDGQFLATVSPRRYFCNQCHVVQVGVAEPVKNTFVDIDSLLANEKGAADN